jgi:molybdopterin-guanine dinucleotide biosynthesis protein A
VAGIEAGLQACRSAWALFLPVDLPLLPSAFLRDWCEATIARPGTRASYVSDGADVHPAICLVARDCAAAVSRSIKAGVRRVGAMLDSLDGLWVADACAFTEASVAQRWFTNVNTPEEHRNAERA